MTRPSTAGWRRTLWLALWAALGCGSAPPVAPTALTGATVHYAPLAMRDDARRPNQAVVLGTDDANGSTVLTLPAQPRQVVVEAAFGAVTLAVTLVAAPGTGGLTGTLPATAPGAARWNAELWSAALATATVLGKDLPDLQLSAQVAPGRDAIAAPALIAAGWLASATGESPDPSTTILGALAPDGGILATPGMEAQLAAALAHGRTKIGIPAGAPELARLARDRHAPVVELATLADAYQLLTHKRLPVPLPVSEPEMALDGDTLRALDALYLGWQSKLAFEWTTLFQLEQTGRKSPTLAKLDADAHRSSEQAEALYRAGKLPAAYARVVDAWVRTATANRTRRVLRTLDAGQLDEALRQLVYPALGEPSLGTVLDKIGALRPSSVTGHLAMVDGFQTLLRGWSHMRAEQRLFVPAAEQIGALRGKPDDSAEAAAVAIAPAITMRLRSMSEIFVADEQLALAPDQGTPALPPTPARLAASLFAAATAQLRDLAALSDPSGPGSELRPIVDTLAGPEGDIPRESITAWQDSPASDLIALASYIEALHAAGVLIAQRDTFGARSADALRPLLLHAARTARAAARAARIATGAIPLRARLAYQEAGGLITGSVEDQFAALAALWASTDASRVAVMLSRN